jgi:hypothetical protein
MTTLPILVPVVVLVLWSLFMGMWMMFMRVPAIIRQRMRLDPNALRGEQMNTLPPHVRWKADNYNNLMEQPTLFYAIILVLAISGKATYVHLALAWTYVGLRVVHSLIQALANIVRLRFAAFLLSSITLIILTINTLISFLF